MPGAVWKARTANLGTSIERCKEQMDRLEKFNNVENYSKEIFKNANTRVEVCIKTRAPSADLKKSGKDWSSLMSDDTTMSEVKDVRPRANRPKSVKTLVNKKTNKDSKHYSKPTKSSLAARKSPLSKSAARPPADEPDSCKAAQLQFPIRTVKVLLKEMKWSIRHDVAGAERVLEDLEFVTDNLDLTKSHKTSVSKGAEDSTTERWSSDKKSQLFEMTLLRSENNRLITENKDLKRSLSESAQSLSNFSKEIKDRDSKINDLKLIITSLTSNNNEMLHILTTKASMEDESQQLMDKNRQLLKELDLQKSHNKQLENILAKNQSEITRMQRIIGDLKSSLNLNIESQNKGFVNLNFPDSTIEFDMSSDIKSFDGNDDNDSALGDGISESLALASATQMLPNPDVENKRSIRQTSSSHVPDDKFSKVSQHSKNQSTRVFHESLQDLNNIGIDSEPDGSFHPLPLEISEAGSSDDQVTEPNTRKSTAKETKSTASDEERKALLQYASQKVDAKVQSFLEKLRNDKKFQISFSSDMMKPREAFSTIGDISGLTSDVDSTQLTESKFRHGLDDPTDTFNLSDNSRFNE